MSKAKLTEWIPASQKPVRKGVYQLDTGFAVWFSKWDGNKWLLTSRSAERAAMIENDATSYEFKAWRGLARRPR